MKALLLVLFVSAFCLAAVPRAGAREPGNYDDFSADSMLLDAIIARPLCLVATGIGTGLFIASLPITLISRSTEKAGKVLVAKPAAATFTRKLGDWSSLN